MYDEAARTLKKRHKLLMRFLAGSTLLLVGYGAASLFGYVQGWQSTLVPPPAGYYRVVEVADGDTFSVSMDGIEERVRLVGIDTPETHKPNTPVQCYGPEASDFTASLIQHKAVQLKADSKQPNRDKYGRLLRYAYLENGDELNELLMREGYALATSFNTEKKKTLQELQQQAKDAKKGLWGNCTVETVNGRLQTNEL
ncbi:MAG TPA: thermonuclease family protein [Candidatus Saccharimonadales bacterium]